MSRLQLVTSIEAAAECCFDLSCDIDVHLGSMDFSGERAVGGVTSGLIGPGEEVTWEARHLGITWRMTSKVTEFERPDRFVDEMQHGPFTSFHHEHRFERNGEATTMIDVVDYQLPLGPLGVIADAVIAKRYLHHLLETRNRYIKAAAEKSS